MARQRWELELSLIEHQPYASGAWNHLLSQMDIHYLFFLCLRSKFHFDAVMHFIAQRELPWASDYEDIVPHVPGDRFFALSKEIQQAILEQMPLRERVFFGATCRRNRAFVARLTWGHHVNLTMVEIVTGTVISGSAVLRLSLAHNSPHAFQPNDLDLYSPDGCWPYVLEFLMSGTAFKFLRFQAHTYGLPAVREIAWLSSHVDNPLTLNIMRSRGPHPVEPILQFHSSSVVGAVDANGVWFGNPRLLTEGRAIMNRLHFRLDTIGARTRALTVLQKYAARGFKFSLDYINRHTCGRNRNCPATIRTTVEGRDAQKFPDYELDHLLSRTLHSCH
ncbi:hypothetical protein B0H13DRAFT_1850413 [Mycena leptocephala]|nr:hypothetical protein B0H13DRAFT_1850413 [Mycena leptocephala]